MEKNEVLKEEIGQKVCEIRKNTMHMTKNQFAQLIGMKSQYLGLVENGKKGLTIERIVQICDKTGVSADYLLRGINNSIEEKAKNIISGYTPKQINMAFDIMKNLAIIIHD